MLALLPPERHIPAAQLQIYIWAQSQQAARERAHLSEFLQEVKTGTRPSDGLSSGVWRGALSSGPSFQDLNWSHNIENERVVIQ